MSFSFSFVFSLCIWCINTGRYSSTCLSVYLLVDVFFLSVEISRARDRLLLLAGEFFKCLSLLSLAACVRAAPRSILPVGLSFLLNEWKDCLRVWLRSQVFFLSPSLPHVLLNWTNFFQTDRFGLFLCPSVSVCLSTCLALSLSLCRSGPEGLLEIHRNPDRQTDTDPRVHVCVYVHFPYGQFFSLFLSLSRAFFLSLCFSHFLCSSISFPPPPLFSPPPAETLASRLPRKRRGKDLVLVLLLVFVLLPPPMWFSGKGQSSRKTYMERYIGWSPIFLSVIDFAPDVSRDTRSSPNFLTDTGLLFALPCISFPVCLVFPFFFFFRRGRSRS